MKISQSHFEKGGKNRKAKGPTIPEEMSDNIENEDDLIMDQANMGGIDQEQLTAEEKDE